MCTIDTYMYMVVASSCRTLDLDMNSRAYTRIKERREKGRESGRQKGREGREGRRVGGRKAHVTLNGNVLGCNMYS